MLIFECMIHASVYLLYAHTLIEINNICNMICYCIHWNRQTQIFDTIQLRCVLRCVRDGVLCTLILQSAFIGKIQNSVHNMQIN